MPGFAPVHARVHAAQCHASRPPRRGQDRPLHGPRCQRPPGGWRRGGLQLGLALMLAVEVLNLGYGCEGTGESLDSNSEKDVFITKEEVAQLAAGFLSGHDPRDPQTMPLHADLGGFEDTDYEDDEAPDYFEEIED